jgi:hypothetical protein
MEHQHGTKKQVFHRKRLLKVERSSFLASLLLRGVTFFCFGKKSKGRKNLGFYFFLILIFFLALSKHALFFIMRTKTRVVK